MPLLQKACCCLELATGTAILGWIGAVLSVINLIYGIVNLAAPEVAAGPAIVTVITAIIQLVISILLIRGAMTRNRRFIPPWLIITIINLIIVNITYIYVAFATGQFTLIGSVIIADLIVGYLWACVYSFYQELETTSPSGIV